MPMENHRPSMTDFATCDSNVMPQGTAKNETGSDRIPLSLEIQRHSIGACPVLRGSPHKHLRSLEPQKVA